MSDRRYNGGMHGRLTASLVALVILVTGVVPAVASYRCIAMGLRMEAPSPCCQHEDGTPRLKAQCCQSVAAAQAEPRRAPSSADTIIQPPSVVAWIVFPPMAPAASTLDVANPARARGRPPGERLHLLSTILRV